jgi:serine/threonine protein kinase
MGKYTKSQNEVDSEYESDGGTKYSATEKLGKGTSARVRKLTSKDNNNKNYRVVLDPINPLKIDSHEMKNKFKFFYTMYEKAEIFKWSQKTTNKLVNYRMILPYIPGKIYNKVNMDDSQNQWSIFKSAVKAIRVCHEKKRIIIDIKEDNVHFDEETGISYFIDGGMSTEIDQSIPKLFKQENENKVIQKRTKYPYLAPECWSTNEVEATEEMDVYSFFYMFYTLLKSKKDKDPIIVWLCILGCQDDPSIRPHFDDIDMLLNNEKLQQVLLDLIKEYETKLSKFENENQQIETLKMFVLRTIWLAIKGKDEFEEQYDETKTIVTKVDNEIGAKYEKLILEALTSSNELNVEQTTINNFCN